MATIQYDDTVTNERLSALSYLSRQENQIEHVHSQLTRKYNVIDKTDHMQWTEFIRLQCATPH